MTGGFQPSEYGQIPDHWEIASLGSISEKITDGAHASPKGLISGKLMCSVKDMTYGNFDFANTKLISEEDFDNLQRQGCRPKIGDVLISKDGANCLDLIFVFRQPEEVVLLSSIAIVRPKEGVSSEFLRYFLLSPACQFIMKSNFVSGSAIPRVVLKDFRDVSIPLPPTAEQKAIAEVLASLDEKIDLLHRQNATLEALAETFFRQYFIEEAQDCWGEEALDKVANYLNGLACQKYPAKNPVERLPVLKIKDLKGGLSGSSDWATSKVPTEYIVENGDIIFSWSASLLVKLWDGPTCVLNQHLFKVTSDRFPDWFIYQWTKHHLERFIAIAETKATTMGHIKRTDLAEAMVRIPDDATLEKMEPVFAPLHAKIIANNRQIATLEQKRDELLPKLMSGEVRVSLEHSNA